MHLHRFFLALLYGDRVHTINMTDATHNYVVPNLFCIFFNNVLLHSHVSVISVCSTPFSIFCKYIRIFPR